MRSPRPQNANPPAIAADAASGAAARGGSGISRRAKIGVSLLLALHLAAVISAPLAVAPSSGMFGEVFEIFHPYLDACYLNNGYHFFGPEPGPSQLVRYEIELADGQRVEGIFPDKQQQRPRLLYHRYFMLTSRLDADLELPWVKAYIQSYARHLYTQYEARSVTLYRRTHELASPQSILEGNRLDDPRSYHEVKLLTYSGDDR